MNISVSTYRTLLRSDLLLVVISPLRVSCANFGAVDVNNCVSRHPPLANIVGVDSIVIYTKFKLDLY